MLLNLSEVFDSVQGEGLFLGTKQVFVRLAGCNLSCSYCDTSWSWDIPENFNIILDDFNVKYTNPISPDILGREIARLLPTNTYAVSITGGEPLMQAEALCEFLPPIREKTKILLETNGTLPDKLKIILPLIDIISMDIKFPRYSGRNLLKEHEEFLKLSTVKETYVKIVVGDEKDFEEVLFAAEMIASINKATPLVIQPLSNDQGKYILYMESLYALQGKLLEILKDVRIIPQFHKLMGIK